MMRMLRRVVMVWVAGKVWKAVTQRSGQGGSAGAPRRR